jgi:hypothetical protein
MWKYCLVLYTNSNIVFFLCLVPHLSIPPFLHLSCLGCPLEEGSRDIIVGRWFSKSRLFCQLVSKFVSRYVCLSKNPLNCNCTFEYMEIIWNIGECQGSGQTRTGFEDIETFCGSLIVCENPYITLVRNLCWHIWKYCYLVSRIPSNLAS